VRYWERRRVPYNIVLASIFLGWVVFTWPHFKPVLTPLSLWYLVVLGAGANVLYCCGYVAELTVGQLFAGGSWQRWRGWLWLAGTLLAAVFEYYWIGDEIYPYVR
jgi:hypothetical protein